MAKPNLIKMSVDALLKLRADVEATLSRRAKELESQLSRLGRGAQPVWLRDKLKAGAKLEDFAVHKGVGSRKKSKKRRRAKR